jgi:ubiquinone/menaquinone biosynthesis C-methylase UbiE
MDSTAIDDALASLDAGEIAGMDFSTIVGLTNEPNTPSGAGETVRRILQQVPLHASSRVLDVGCNTGFASIEFAGWATASVVGVDINPTSLAFARGKAGAAALPNVSFTQCSALALPFGDSSFDLVYVNNVTSFIRERARAVGEFYRVLRARGVLAVVPIFYHRQPPASLHREVERAVGADIPVRGKDYWHECFATPVAELFFDEEYEYIYQSAERIDWYADHVMSQPHLSALPAATRAALAERLGYFYRLFNDNLSYARFCILLYRKHPPNPEPILFKTRRLSAAD